MSVQDRALVSLRGATRMYTTPAGEFAGIADAYLDVGVGEFVAVVGKSGSGKSTLVNLVTGVDRATSGTVHVAGRDLTELDEDQVAQHRGQHIGVVLQAAHLIPTISVLDNVVLPMDFVGTVPRSQRLDRARELLEQVDVADQADKSPGALSGGQQQRVAIARALANNPGLITADEPTGALDSETAAQVLRVLRALADSGTAVLVVTHDQDAAELADRQVHVADGRIVVGAAL